MGSSTPLPESERDLGDPVFLDATLLERDLDRDLDLDLERDFDFDFDRDFDLDFERDFDFSLPNDFERDLERLTLRDLALFAGDADRLLDPDRERECSDPASICSSGDCDRLSGSSGLSGALLT